jgi:hypothetical protein
MPELEIWSPGSEEWRSRPADEITWLDRALLSDGHDVSLHRPPRCAGLRYVQHHWELFSRDPTHSVYLARSAPGPLPDHGLVENTSEHVLPVAGALLEARPVRLEAGGWVLSVGNWVLALRIEAASDDPTGTAVPDYDLAPTSEVAVGTGQEPSTAPEAGAVDRVARYFERNPTACLAMAYYYQEFIAGAVAPHPEPIADVVVALDLGSENTVSEYKKELQRRIWNEQGHQRELSEFLLVNALITHADLTRARQVAAANYASGRSELARERLRYISRKQRRG